MRYLSVILSAGLLLASGGSHALEVFACEPEWGAMLQEIGADKVSVYVATSAQQDVHQVEARPSLIAKMRRTEFVVCTGAELEVGWLPQLTQQAGNQLLQNHDRLFYAAEQVALLDKPGQLDRSQGDVHAAGNPHVQLDPQRMLIIAQHLAERLALVDAPNAAFYQQRYQQFAPRWQEAMTHWQQQAADLRGKNIIVRHDNLRYLAEWLGINVVAKLEPKPGLPPTSAHLAEVLAIAQAQHVYAVVQAAYEDPHSGEWLSGKADIPLKILPYTVGGTDKANTLFGLMDDSIALLKQVKK